MESEGSDFFKLRLLEALLKKTITYMSFMGFRTSQRVGFPEHKRRNGYLLSPVSIVAR